MSTTTQPSEPRISPCAVWSLVLGILAPLTCLTALPGVITGIFGIANIKRSGGAYKGLGMAITGLVISSLVTLSAPIVLSIAIPVYNGVIEKAKETQATVNAKTLAMGIEMWAMDHDGQIPPDFGALVDVGMTEAAISEMTMVDNESLVVLELVLQGKLRDHPAGTPLIMTSSPIGASGKERHVIVYTDGSVQVVPVSDLDSAP